MDQLTPKLLTISINIDGMIFTCHTFDDEQGRKVRHDWLIYLIETVEPKMNAATLFQVRVP